MKRHTIEEVIKLILDFYKNAKVGESTTEPFYAEDSLGLPYYLTHITDGNDNHAIIVREECDGLWTRSLVIPMNSENGTDEITEALEWYFNN